MIEQIRQLSGQFGFMRVFLSVLGGTAKKNAIQEWVVAQMNEDDENDPPKKYKDLEGEDKAGVDAIADAFTQLSGIFDEAIEAKAAMCFKFYKSLQKAGFDKGEALAIVAAQGADIMKAGKE